MRKLLLECTDIYRDAERVIITGTMMCYNYRYHDVQMSMLTRHGEHLMAFHHQQSEKKRATPTPPPPARPLGNSHFSMLEHWAHANRCLLIAIN